MIFLDKAPDKHVGSIINLEIYESDVEKAHESYNNAILDIFDKQLSVDEADLFEIGSFMNFNLKYENRYIKAMEEFYILNKSKIIVEVSLYNLETFKILTILEYLDYKEKLLFIDLIRANKNNSNIVLIEDFEHLHLFIKLATRELLFPMFHFTNIGIVIVGSFDLSFPIFFEKRESIEKYLIMVKKNELFFRNIKLI